MATQAAQLKAASETSAWASFTNFVSEATSWTCKQVVWLKDKTVDLAGAIYQWAQPFFDVMSKFFASMWTSVSTFVAHNKANIAIAVVALIAGALIYGIGFALCCSDNVVAQKPVVANPNPAAAAAANPGAGPAPASTVVAQPQQQPPASPTQSRPGTVVVDPNAAQV